ncbi:MULTISPECIES: chaplin family protein [unclassified Streptomyces]|uniref:chaplin n=1 Tax=unclassified Streptomyces TaxID=2593676 RepID=UPI00236621ED|nr:MULTISPECIES: chaplin family protein [unclassified Streptomyces]MDF3142642.1 chaplin family protein [Streptomyces sp. T21Q-yed]WDF36904.1 chaplin family protein [Streptomyces sp. T12]
MRQVTRKGLMTMAAATGVIAAAGGAAHATGSGADGTSTNSPGVLSGNTVQAPVHAPVNVCGNTVNVVGLLNPASGNSCSNQGGASAGHGDSGGGSGASTGGHASDSPGIGSGNHVEAPVDVPVNVCGNSVDVIGIGNSVEGNDCTNGGGGSGHTPPGGGHETPPGSPEQPGNPGNPGNPENPGNPGSPQNPVEPTHPGTPSTPPSTGGETPGGGSSHGNQPGAQSVTQPQGDAELAQTGSDLPMGLVLPVGAGALLAGSVLYRKARASA